ncbi:MAG: ABC transporter permease [candidate division KSB1 bacterium]|nr:ABC transporter permease [candidate division KSB1 bacterium]MDZ7305133.1 ABC transporter permease [candidate division KSB1 bacterium]MDZ7311737.1 ABC transporter permease [candidate division KSB1 bacterium]
MLANIIKKEFLENLLNQRFAISLVLAALISWTSAFILTKNYNDEVKDYYRRVNLQNRMIDDYFHLRGWDGGLMMPPKPAPKLSCLVQGIQRGLTILGSIDENPVIVLFPFMDILFVIGMIMSIAALILSYDRLSGEKEAGTLRLLLVSSHGRAKLLLGKWVGGLLSVVIILVISLLGSVLIAYTLSESSWTSTEWVTLLALFVLSMLYCAVFYSLGLVISAKTHTPSDSIILALVFWVLFTIILPTVPPYIANVLHPVPSPARVQYEAFVILKQEEDAAIRKIQEPYYAKGMKDEEIRAMTKAEVDKIVADYEDRADKLKTSAVRGSAKREGITALLHLLSPFSSYALAGAELTATGALSQFDFYDKANRYVGILYRGYLPKKEEEAKRADPNFTGTTKLDIRDRPGFQYQEESITSRLLASAAHTAFLLIYTVLFFVLAWKAFLRYDVR